MQIISRDGSVGPTGVQLRPSQAWRLGRLGGELQVLQGRVWLTRRGRADDLLLSSGDFLRLEVDQDAVIESYDAGSPATIRFVPRRQGFAGALLEAPLRGLAVLTAGMARVFVALALSAASSARRAQGRIA